MVNADLISRARHMSEPTPSIEGTITQNTDDVYTLPWVGLGKVPLTERRFSKINGSVR